MAAFQLSQHTVQIPGHNLFGSLSRNLIDGVINFLTDAVTCLSRSKTMKQYVADGLHAEIADAIADAGTAALAHINRAQF